MPSRYAEIAIATLALGLEPADRQPFQEAAERALASLPTEGDGAAYCAIESVWSRYFKPPPHNAPKNRGRSSRLQIVKA
jgi:hypothetical protein